MVSYEEGVKECAARCFLRRRSSLNKHSLSGLKTLSLEFRGEVFNIYMEGIQHTLLSKATYKKKIRRKKEKHISVGTVRMFIEPSAKH